MPPKPEPIEDLLPLPLATFHVLLALQEGELHGYGVKKRVEELSDGAVRMAPGTLYETLHRMRERGLIEEPSGGAGDGNGHAQRKDYRLTAFGRRVLRAEVERVGGMIDHARAVLAEGEGGG